MCHVSHTITGTTHGREQLDCNISHDKPLGLDGEWEWNNEQPFVGEYHAESQQDAIDGTRGANRRPQIDIGVGRHLHTACADILIGGKSLHRIGNILYQFLRKTGTYSTTNVIKKEFFRAPYTFYY